MSRAFRAEIEHRVQRRSEPVDQRFGDGALPRRRVLAHGDGDAVEAAHRGAAQDVEGADAGRGQDQALAVGPGGGEQALEQSGVGEGADRGHEKVRAAFQHALAVGAHGLVAGAFGDGVEFPGKEAIRLVRQEAPMERIVARALHQHRHQFQILDVARLQRRLDMLADGAIADQAELQGHESLRSTQRAQAMSWSSRPRGPTSCTDSGKPNGPVLKGSAMHGIPKRVQKRLKIGSPVLPRPTAPPADGAAEVEALPGIAELRQRHTLALPGIGILPAADSVAFGHDGLQAGRKEMREARPLAGEGLRRLLGHDAMLRLHEARPGVGRLPFAHHGPRGAEAAPLPRCSSRQGPASPTTACASGRCAAPGGAGRPARGRRRRGSAPGHWPRG
jgi:hypothetical protein